MSDIHFKRGTTFCYAFEIPEDIPNGYFKNWFINSQIRKAKTDQESGLIASLAYLWENTDTTRMLYLLHPDTDDWPMGEAELDIVFEDVDGFRIRSETVSVTIERGITR